MFQLVCNQSSTTHKGILNAKNQINHLNTENLKNISNFIIKKIHFGILQRAKLHGMRTMT